MDPSKLPWKVLINENDFFLTKSITINAPSWTEITPSLDRFMKYSIYCKGTMTECSMDKIIIEA